MLASLLPVKYLKLLYSYCIFSPPVISESLTVGIFIDLEVSKVYSQDFHSSTTLETLCCNPYKMHIFVSIRCEVRWWVAYVSLLQSTARRLPPPWSQLQKLGRINQAIWKRVEVVEVLQKLNKVDARVFEYLRKHRFRAIKIIR